MAGRRPFFRRPVVILIIILVAALVVFKKPLLSHFYASDLLGKIAGVLYGPSPEYPPATGRPERVSIEITQPVAKVDERFLSLAVDSSQVAGGHWWSKSAEKEGGLGAHKTDPFDFTRPRLIAMAKELAPAYIRIGGSEADVLFYDMSDKPIEPAPGRYDLVFTRQHWDAIHTFARETGMSLFFTINAGLGPRDAAGAWTPDNARTLLEYSKERGYDVDVWELGNEINLFWFQYGRNKHVDGERYARDFSSFRTLVREYYPDAKLAGPSSFYWPLVGEPAGFMYGVMEDFLKNAGKQVDVVTWHYYPQQSRRCGMAVRWATPTRLLNPGYLDEVDKWAASVENLRNQYAPQAEVWLGEVGNAQCGGEPEVSDRYVGGLWWLDQLGRTARRGQPVIVRQTLSGSNYGMIDDSDLTPNPDYWNSVLWKRLMGSAVLKAKTSGENPFVRAYAHCTPGKCGSVTLLLLNVSPDIKATIILDNALNKTGATIWRLTGPRLTGRELRLNGNPLEMQGDTLPPLDGVPYQFGVTESIELEPASYAFVVLPQAGSDACQCK
jgi:heparanase 1